MWAESYHETEKRQAQTNALAPMKKQSAGRRRFYHHSPRTGICHASASIAQVAASLYFKLAGGTAAQQQLADEWRTMFLQLREGVK